jgi:hypothetical protein
MDYPRVHTDYAAGWEIISRDDFTSLYKTLEVEGYGRGDLGDDTGEVVAYDGETPEGFFDYTLEVFHVFGLVESDWLSLRYFIDFLLKFTVCSEILGEIIRQHRHGRRRRI